MAEYKEVVISFDIKLSDVKMPEKKANCGCNMSFDNIIETISKGIKDTLVDIDVEGFVTQINAKVEADGEPMMRALNF